jgi:tetrahydromethanopterin S-methyltransferase subunit G
MDETVNKVVFLLSLSIQDLNKRVDTIEKKIKLFEESLSQEANNDQ